MDKFNNIIVAAEQFLVQKYLRDVEEAFSLKQYSSDIFAAFRRQALLKIAPALLRDVSGISSLQLPGAPENLLLQNDTNEHDGISPRIATRDDKVQANLWAKRRHALSEHVEYVSRELKRRRLNWELLHQEL